MLGAIAGRIARAGPDERNAAVMAEALQRGHRRQLRRGRHAGRGHHPHASPAPPPRRPRRAEATRRPARATCSPPPPRPPARRSPAPPTSCRCSATPASSTPAAAGSCVILDAAETALTGSRPTPVEARTRTPAHPGRRCPTDDLTAGRAGLRGDVPPRRRGRPHRRRCAAGPGAARRLAGRGRRRGAVERPRPRRRRRRRDRGRASRPAARTGSGSPTSPSRSTRARASTPTSARAAGSSRSPPGRAWRSCSRRPAPSSSHGGPGRRPSHRHAPRRDRATAAPPRSSCCPTTPTRSRVAQIAARTAEETDEHPGRGHPDPRAGAGPGRARRPRARPHLRPGRPRDDRHRPARPPRRGHGRGQAGDHDGRPVRARRRPRRDRRRLRGRRRRTSTTSPPTSSTGCSAAAASWSPSSPAPRTRTARWPSAARRGVEEHAPDCRRRGVRRWPGALPAAGRRRVAGERRPVISLDSPVADRARRAPRTRPSARAIVEGLGMRDRRRPAAPLPAPLPQDRRAHRGRRASRRASCSPSSARSSQRGQDLQGPAHRPARRTGWRRVLATDGPSPADDVLRQAPAASPSGSARRLHARAPRASSSARSSRFRGDVAAHQPADGAVRRGRRRGRGRRASCRSSRSARSSRSTRVTKGVESWDLQRAITLRPHRRRRAARAAARRRPRRRTTCSTPRTALDWIHAPGRLGPGQAPPSSGSASRRRWSPSSCSPGAGPRVARPGRPAARRRRGRAAGRVRRSGCRSS